MNPEYHVEKCQDCYAVRHSEGEYEETYPTETEAAAHSRLLNMNIRLGGNLSAAWTFLEKVTCWTESAKRAVLYAGSNLMVEREDIQEGGRGNLLVKLSEALAVDLSPAFSEAIRADQEETYRIFLQLTSPRESKTNHSESLDSQCSTQPELSDSLSDVAPVPMGSEAGSLCGESNRPEGLVEASGSCADSPAETQATGNLKTKLRAELLRDFDNISTLIQSKLIAPVHLRGWADMLAGDIASDLRTYAQLLENEKGGKDATLS